jgi:hypothetical protein
MVAVSRGTPADMRDHIDFGEARLVKVSAVDGNVMPDQGARFGAIPDRRFVEVPPFGVVPIVDAAERLSSCRSSRGSGGEGLAAGPLSKRTAYLRRYSQVKQSNKSALVLQPRIVQVKI